MLLIALLIRNAKMEYTSNKKIQVKLERNRVIYLKYIEIIFLFRLRIYFTLDVVLFPFQSNDYCELGITRSKRAVRARYSDRFAWNEVKPSIYFVLPEENARSRLKEVKLRDVSFESGLPSTALVWLLGSLSRYGAARRARLGGFE